MSCSILLPNVSVPNNQINCAFWLLNHEAWLHYGPRGLLPWVYFKKELGVYFRNKLLDVEWLPEHSVCIIFAYFEDFKFERFCRDYFYVDCWGVRWDSVSPWQSCCSCPLLISSVPSIYTIDPLIRARRHIYAPNLVYVK